MALMSSCRYYPQEVFWQSKWSVLSEWFSAQLCSVSVFSVLQILVQYAKAVFLCCTNVFSLCVLQYAQAVFFPTQVDFSAAQQRSVSKPASGRCLSGKILFYIVILSAMFLSQVDFSAVQQWSVSKLASGWCLSRKILFYNMTK